jgi:hypothetical protein
MRGSLAISHIGRITNSYNPPGAAAFLDSAEEVERYYSKSRAYPNQAGNCYRTRDDP